MNAIDDVSLISQLYQASQAGVQIDLIIRGHSRLRPGVPGFSDNICVISILGRFWNTTASFISTTMTIRHLYRQCRLARAQSQ
ncbi:MAG: hypothetical protein R3E31_10020 [Chloroflexota bacterium]